MDLNIREFPEDLARALKLEALGAGVTLRALVIRKLGGKEEDTGSKSGVPVLRKNDADGSSSGVRERFERKGRKRADPTIGRAGVRTVSGDPENPRGLPYDYCGFHRESVLFQEKGLAYCTMTGCKYSGKMMPNKFYPRRTK